MAELAATPEEAKARGETQYFNGKPCKNGHVAARRRAGRHCVECERAYRQAYDRSPAYREYVSAYNKTPAQRERLRAYDKSPAMRVYNRAFCAHRRALKLKATPRWLTDEHKAAMRAIYQEAARLTTETGILHHVDHIVPLRATCPVTKKRIASGLHCPWNLQVIPASDNWAKNCHFNDWK